LANTHLSTLFDTGALYRPDGAGSVHLFRALSLLCGCDSIARDGHVAELSGAIGEYSHYVYILIDGMGTSLDEHLPKDGWFTNARRMDLSSVYPSTTAVALTSQATGLWPSEHGVTGWHTHLPDRGVTVLPLRATERKSGQRLKQLEIPFREVVKPDSIIPKYSRRKRVFMKKSIRGGPFAKWSFPGITRTGTSTRSQAFDRLRRHIRGSTEPSFSYLYLEELDSMSHRHGSHSRGVHSLIKRIDQELTTLRDDAGEQVRIIVTADHGHIDADPERHHLLHEGDPLLDLLQAPPSGESRNPIFHVQPGRESEFKDLFTKQFSEDFLLCEPDDIESEKLMGPAKLAVHTRSRLGTFIGIATGPGAIEYVSADGESKHHKGMHGGLSGAEIKVPLFLL
jgi:hypothetical protein